MISQLVSTTSGSTFLAFGFPGHWEWVVLLILGLLIFGKRLPEVGRSIGKSIVEFKRGIKGIEDDVESEASRPREKDKPRLDDKSDDIPAAKVAGEGANPYAAVEDKERSD